MLPFDYSSTPNRVTRRAIIAQDGRYAMGLAVNRCPLGDAHMGDVLGEHRGYIISRREALCANLPCSIILCKVEVCAL